MRKLTDQQLEKARKAQALAAEGKSLYAIATALGVTKEWLREYAGLR